jgi:hypothetical protein
VLRSVAVAAEGPAEVVTPKLQAPDPAAVESTMAAEDRAAVERMTAVLLARFP